MERLSNACKGKSASQGGLNVPELSRLAAARGYTGSQKRADLITFLCNRTAKAPKLPRGQVGINTEAWKTRKPTTKTQRKQMSEKCGAKCYLVPELEKYPVCAKGSCDYDCDGIRSAKNLTYLIVNSKRNGAEAKDRAMRARKAAEDLGLKHCGWSL